MKNQKTIIKNFENIINDFEKQYKKACKNDFYNNIDYSESLYSLAKFISFSVLKKIYNKSGNIYILYALYDLVKSCKQLDFYKYADTFNTYEYNSNGNIVSIKQNAEIEKLYSKINNTDLLNECVCILLELCEKYNTNMKNFMLVERTEKRLSNKVRIQTDTSNKYKDTTFTILTDTYKKLRQYIANNSSVKVDSNSKYTYIADTLIDTNYTDDEKLEKIYYRTSQFADINNITEYKEHEYLYSEIVKELSPQQKTILNYRLKGYGYKAIASALNCRADNIVNQLKRIQEKTKKVYLVKNIALCLK